MILKVFSNLNGSESMRGEQWIDEGKAVDIVYLDIDTVLNKILIVKLLMYELDKQTVRWIENRLNGHGLEDLFNIINNLDDGAECTLSNADDAKLGGVAERPECHSAIQRDLNRLEEWTDRNLDKGKCKVLHSEMKNTVHQHMLRATQLESSLTEKDLGVLVDTRLNMSQ
ncbi:mitochondrial enolase superfamily member 1 [Grus japonensis]|uniref:Mitochondrial enolase superfamily member 1 n=1 Tax=Grus japonensis TaxID=30415 RepID=A0ABC9W7L4_GRUJA